MLSADKSNKARILDSAIKYQMYETKLVLFVFFHIVAELCELSYLTLSGAKSKHNKGLAQII